MKRRQAWIIAVQHQSMAASAIAASGSHGVSMPARSASHHSAVMNMNAGSTITSRDSREVRHVSPACQARSGPPTWPSEAPGPIGSIASPTISVVPTKPSDTGKPASTAGASITIRPCAAPAIIVKIFTEQVGFMTCGLPAHHPPPR